MAEWMTGAMLVDQLVIEMFAGIAQALNDPSGMTGVAVVDMPTELSAVAQVERTAPIEKTGLLLYYWTVIFHNRDCYPI